MSQLAGAAAVCAALCVVLGLGWLRGLHGGGLRVGRAPRQLPWALRAAWLLSGPWLVILRPVLPPRVDSRLQAQLQRCDLDGVLDPTRWVALRLSLASVLGLVAMPLAQALHWQAAISALVAASLGWVLASQWLVQRRVQRERQILKDLPANLDVLTLCVEAGATLTAALRMVVDKSGDTPLRAVFDRVLREVRAGRTRLEALEHVARVYRLPCLDALVMALLQSESAGMSLGGVLRAQAGQRAAERHQRAERLALQAPVKMLAPLVLCIFPCTFVVLAVPIAARLLAAGVP